MLGTFSKILKKFVGDKASDDLKVFQPIVEQVNTIGRELTSISNDELRQRAERMKQLIQERIAPIENEINELKAQAEGLPGTELEMKETIFQRVDALEKESDKKTEEVLDEIMPEAFAVVKETARRLKENAELRVTASQNDRDFAASGTKPHIRIEGDQAIWSSSWLAAGNIMKWDMVHYDVQLIGGAALHKGKVSEMATGEGKTLGGHSAGILKCSSRKRCSRGNGK
jgi:preprotein translocase subunit SecA